MDSYTIRTLQPTPFSEALRKHYLSQSGGGAPSYPVFRGSAYQHGQGIGDIFRHIGRWLAPFLPVAVDAAKTFISGTASNLSQGKSIKEAAKSAISPTIKGAATGIGEAMASKINGQSGSGLRRGRRRRQGRRTRKRVYKGASHKRVVNKIVLGRKRKRATHKKKAESVSKKLRFLLHPPNF